MPSTCTFSFDRPNPVYYSGETINGSISLRTTSDKNIRGVYIIFEGVAKVRWEESRSGKVNIRTDPDSVVYSGNETFISTQRRVFGEGTLPPGTHECTFNIPLPPQCPTSCSEEYGSISYEISLKMDRPFPFDNIFTQRLTVIKQLNLNHRPQLLLPLIVEDIQYFCCWPCSSGPVLTTLTIPFSGWAPGQEIHYKLEIDNQSPQFDVHTAQLKLKQIYHFAAHSPKHKIRTLTNCLTRLEQEDRHVSRFRKRIFEDKLHIPSVPPTSIGGGIISISYRIELDIQMADCKKDSEIWMPITIGTIPLAQSAANPVHFITIPRTPSTPDIPDRPPSYDIYKPPTFEEAADIGKQFTDTDRDEYQNKSIEGWLPQYPMYKGFAVTKATRTPTAPPPYTSEDCSVMDLRPLLNLQIGPDITLPHAPSRSQSSSPQPSTSQRQYPTTGGFGGMSSMPSSSRNS